jgi:uncharacterized protein YndB with AHSA1/START domain
MLTRMRLSAERVVDRPAEEVFSFFADSANNPEWQQGMISCAWTTDPPIGVGSAYEQRARFMGREVVSTFEVTRFEPGRLIEIETVESTFPIRVIRRVEPLGDGSTRVSAEISGGPEGGVMKLLAPIVTRRAQKSVDADYDRLVQLLEP